MGHWRVALHDTRSEFIAYHRPFRGGNSVGLGGGGARRWAQLARSAADEASGGTPLRVELENADPAELAAAAESQGVPRGGLFCFTSAGWVASVATNHRAKRSRWGPTWLVLASL